MWNAQKTLSSGFENKGGRRGWGTEGSVGVREPQERTWDRLECWQIFLEEQKGSNFWWSVMYQGSSRFKNSYLNEECNVGSPSCVISSTPVSGGRRPVPLPLCVCVCTCVWGRDSQGECGLVTIGTCLQPVYCSLSKPPSFLLKCLQALLCRVLGRRKTQINQLETVKKEWKSNLKLWALIVLRYRDALIYAYSWIRVTVTSEYQ